MLSISDNYSKNQIPFKAFHMPEKAELTKSIGPKLAGSLESIRNDLAEIALHHRGDINLMITLRKAIKVTVGGHCPHDVYESTFAPKDNVATAITKSVRDAVASFDLGFYL